MRILHTSDLHLNASKSITVETLETLLELGKKESIDLLTIGGDMFDSEADADALRPILRTTLSGNGFPILVIPGNHDRNAFAGNTYYGDDLRVALEDPFQIEEFADTTVVALPYRESPDEELIASLLTAVKKKRKRKTWILLLHCTLDMGFGTHDFGDEAGTKYFPITSSMLAQFNFDYILAGHFHSTPYQKALPNGGVFIYPGSPVSLSTKELGRRSVALLDTNDGTCRFIYPDTFYYDHHVATVYPGNEDTTVKEIENWVRKRRGHNCDLRVTVNGFIKGSERGFSSALANAVGPAQLDARHRSVRHVLDYPLYRRFKKKLESLDEVQDRTLVDMLTIEVFSRLLSERCNAV